MVEFSLLANAYQFSFAKVVKRFCFFVCFVFIVVEGGDSTAVFDNV